MIKVERLRKKLILIEVVVLVMAIFLMIFGVGLKVLRNEVQDQNRIIKQLESNINK
jgi:Tfp pilus assembly protein PilN